jgi:hypothetical protein
MQFQTTSNFPPTRTSGNKHLLAAACSAALLAAVAIGTWQTIANRENTAITAVQQSPAIVAPAQGTDAGTVRNDESAPTTYLVASAAQAAQVEETIRGTNTILDQFGKPPFIANVIVVESAELEAGILQGQYDADAIRAGMGLPPMPLIDLRAR